MPNPLKTSPVIHVNRLTDFDAKNVGKYTIPFPWIIWVGSPEAMNPIVQCSNGEGSNNPPPSRGQMHRCGKSHMCATSGGLSMGQHVVTVLIPITSKISVFRTSSKSSSSWDSWVKNLTHQLLKVFFFVTSFRDDISSEKTFNFFGVGEKNLCYFHGGSTNPTLNGTFNEALLDPDFGGDTLGGDWLLELA